MNEDTIPDQAVGYVLPSVLQTGIYQFTVYFIRGAAEANSNGEEATALYPEAAVEKAILAERERCAKILEAYPPEQFFLDLLKRSNASDENGYILSLEGDTGNWAAHMSVLLASYAAAIREPNSP